MGHVMSGFHVIFKGDVALVFDELSERPTHKPLLSREKKHYSGKEIFKAKNIQ